MSKIGFLTDSCSDIPQELADKYGIEVVGFPINLDGVEYMERKDFTNDQFYQMMRDAQGVPTTAAITQLQFCDIYARYADEGYTDLVYLSINAGGSSTYNNAVKAMELLEEERPGYTMSEKKIGETFHNLFKDAKGRIIIAMFASNLHRIQQVVDNCIEFGRKICFVGRSMVNVTKLAMEIGELKIPQDVFIDVGDLDCYEDDEIVVLTTGSQGEPMSGLTRMANSEHRKLQIRQGDTVIISATPIPGNEIMVSRIIDQLYRCGANVIYNRIADVHVSGHACQEELKLMHTLVKPKYFIPVHGEYRMLHRHAQLAQELGMPEDNVIILEMGQALELSEDEANITGPIPTGSVMVDGLGVGDVGNVVLRDRKHLSQDGLIIVVVGVSRETGLVTSGPELISRGFVYVRENEELISGARNVAMNVLQRYDRIEQSDWTSVKNGIKDEVHNYLFDLIKRNPMILPIIMET